MRARQTALLRPSPDVQPGNAQDSPRQTRTRPPAEDHAEHEIIPIRPHMDAQSHWRIRLQTTHRYDHDLQAQHGTTSPPAVTADMENHEWTPATNRTPLATKPPTPIGPSNTSSIRFPVMLVPQSPRAPQRTGPSNRPNDETSGSPLTLTPTL